MNKYYLDGIIMLTIAILLRIFVSRRQFYRRGPGGMQQFKNYSSAVVNTYLERFARFIASALIILGALALLLGYNRSAKEKAKAPATVKAINKK